MPSKQQQADNEIHEDQLLNFLVNVLTETFTLDFGENAEIDPEDIFEVLVGATADGTSISTLCEESEDSPSGNSVLHHLRTKFDLETVESTGNTLLQQDVLETLPEQVEVVADLHLRPYYGDEDEHLYSVKLLTPHRDQHTPPLTVSCGQETVVWPLDTGVLEWLMESNTGRGRS